MIRKKNIKKKQPRNRKREFFMASEKQQVSESLLAKVATRLSYAVA